MTKSKKPQNAATPVAGIIAALNAHKVFTIELPVKNYKYWFWL